MWNGRVTEIWTLVTMSPESFKGGGIWNVVVNINGGLKAIGYGLLVLFFVTGVMKTAGSFTEIKRPEQALKLFDAPNFRSPGYLEVEGDWSGGAFFLAAQWLSSELSIRGLNTDSAQGDRAVLDILKQLETGTPTVSAKDIPDLVPILSVVAACHQGAVFANIQRLRLKESDRVASTVAMIQNLGGKAEADETTLTVFGTGLLGGTVDAVNDHRIAMSAAIASTVCKKDVTILGAECVKKSYPKFWEEFSRLGGNYELNLR